jgi:hypothetical protein
MRPNPECTLSNHRQSDVLKNMALQSSESSYLYSTWKDIKSYMYHTWMANVLRIVKRKACCSQRVRWTQSTRNHVRNSTNGVCFYCRRPFNEKERQTQMHVDHYVAWSKGGSNLLPNLVPACSTCNLRKNDMIATRFTKKSRLRNSFCRHKSSNGKYCEHVPSLGHKFCVNHRLLPYNCLTCS